MATIRTSASASAAAAATVSAGLTPSALSAMAFCGSMSYAVTVCPACEKQLAMGAPHGTESDPSDAGQVMFSFEIALRKCWWSSDFDEPPGCTAPVSPCR
ncbi:MAG TPA: hypothetical protein VIJ23_03585 [Mycobacterium sp.]